MSERVRFWSPYRRGIAIAIVTWGPILIAFFWGIAMLGGSARFHLWPLLALLGITGIAGIDMSPSGGAGGRFSKCPACGKSVFALFGWATETSVTYLGLWWPERQCSKCGYDLTEMSADA
jgi:hypothetical protein